MHPSKNGTNANKRKDVAHHFSAFSVIPMLFVFMEDVISDYCHETNITLISENPVSSGRSRP